MSDLAHLSGADVIGARVDATAPTYGQTASGYGRKVPTRYVLTLTDGRERRVYAAALGNSASLYIVRGGASVYLDGDAERILELMRDGATYGAAREALARELKRHGLATYDVHREG